MCAFYPTSKLFTEFRPTTGQPNMATSVKKNFDDTSKQFSNHPVLLLSLILIIAGTFVFSGIVEHSFVDYDDHRIILDRIDRFDGFTLSNINQIFFADYPREEPLILRDLSYLVNAAIFGPLHPQGYILGNLALHLMVSLLVYYMCLALLPVGHVTASLAACIFFLHPVHVESVVWISSRKDSLYAFFYLLSFLLFKRNLERKDGRRTFGYLLSFFLFICALFSKSAAVSFLPFILLYRFCIHGFKGVSKHETLFYFSVLVATLLYVQWYSGVLQDFGIISEGFSLHRNWGWWFVTSSVVTMFYLKQLLLPFDLSIVYEYPLAVNVFSRPVALSFSLFCFAIIIWITFLLLKRKKYVETFLVGFFFVSLLPYLDLIRVNIYFADRYLYLASVSFCILSALVIQKCYTLLEHKALARTALIAGVVIMLSTYAFQTKEYTASWKNTLALWFNAKEVAPNRMDVYNGLLKEYVAIYVRNFTNETGKDALKLTLQEGNAAVERFCKTRYQCPQKLSSVLNYIAEAYWQLGNHDLAMEYFELAIHNDGSVLENRFMYATFLIETKDYKYAIEQLDMVLENAHPFIDKDMINSIKTNLLPEIKKNM